MAVGEVVSRVVVLVVGIGLVDGVVSEVHVVIIEVALCRECIGLSGKAYESLIVEVDSKGICTGKQHIDTQVEFQTPVEQRIGQVLLNHTPLLFL